MITPEDIVQAIRESCARDAVVKVWEGDLDAITFNGDLDLRHMCKILNEAAERR
jgi:hypothetical protein